MENEKITIPENIQQICRDFAQVAKKHKLIRMKGSFDPRDLWGGEINFSWRSGRHEEDSNELSINSVFQVQTKVVLNEKNNEQ